MKKKINHWLKFICIGSLGFIAGIIMSFLIWFLSWLPFFRFLGYDIEVMCNGSEMCGLVVLPWLLIYRPLMLGFVGMVVILSYYFIKQIKK